MIERKCSCEMGMHRAPLERYIIESGAVNRLPELLKDYNKVYMVCDENTYRVLGERAEQILKSVGKFSHKHILKGDVLPDARNIGDVLIHLNDPKADSDIFKYSPLPDFILAVGSGVVNDVCRVVSYRLGLPYGIAGTAPSMDGYASAGSPTLFDGTKATIKCTTPKYIIADLDVMKEAPFDMLLSGIGDMFGKYIGILDWELARDYNGDYYCREIADEVIEATDRCMKNGYDLKSRSADCIKNIMEGFLVTGLGMAFTGNSRPASGSEHIVAHVWELESVERGEKPNLHGLEVCEGTRIMAEMYRLLYTETADCRCRACRPYQKGKALFLQNNRFSSAYPFKKFLRRVIGITVKLTLITQIKQNRIPVAQAQCTLYSLINRIIIGCDIRHIHFVAEFFNLIKIRQIFFNKRL
jgi:glycerol-1-phosphate dehydrogenase [NAD(P)+]